MYDVQRYRSKVSLRPKLGSSLTCQQFRSAHLSAATAEVQTYTSTVAAHIYAELSILPWTTTVKGPKWGTCVCSRTGTLDYVDELTRGERLQIEFPANCKYRTPICERCLIFQRFCSRDSHKLALCRCFEATTHHLLDWKCWLRTDLFRTLIL